MRDKHIMSYSQKNIDGFIIIFETTYLGDFLFNLDPSPHIK